MEEGTITDAIPIIKYLLFFLFFNSFHLPKTKQIQLILLLFQQMFLEFLLFVMHAELKNKKNNRYLIIGIGYLILFFIVLTPDINNAVGRGIQALLFCVLGYRCEENIRRFIKNR